MWTETNRSGTAGIEKKAKRYPSDPIDEEWDRMLPFMPEGVGKSRRPGVDLREVQLIADRDLRGDSHVEARR